MQLSRWSFAACFCFSRGGRFFLTTRKGHFEAWCVLALRWVVLCRVGFHQTLINPISVVSLSRFSSRVLQTDPINGQSFCAIPSSSSDNQLAKKPSWAIIIFVCALPSRLSALMMMVLWCYFLWCNGQFISPTSEMNWCTNLNFCCAPSLTLCCTVAELLIMKNSLTFFLSRDSFSLRSSRNVPTAKTAQLEITHTKKSKTSQKSFMIRSFVRCAPNGAVI